MPIHIFSDDVSSEGIISNDSSVGSFDAERSSSLMSSVTKGISNKTSESVAHGVQDRVFSHQRARSVDILSDVDSSIETGLSHQSASRYMGEIVKRKTLKTSDLPDPVLEVNEQRNSCACTRTSLFCVMAFIFAAMIATGVALLSTSPNLENTEASALENDNIFDRQTGYPTIPSGPISDPVESRERTDESTPVVVEDPRILALRDIIVSESSIEDLSDFTTDQYMAMRWLALDDEAQLDFDNTPDQEIKDRYKAALLYFALSKGNGWRNMYGFLSPDHICDWNDDGQGYTFEGIRCENGQVVDMILELNRLEGTIPTEVALFDLRALALGSNKISGSIPTELGGLIHLTSLKLGSNNLVGSLPSELGTLTSLQTLVLHQNNIDGAIPATYNSFVNLEYLFIEGTGLSGEVESTFCMTKDSLKDFFASCGADGTFSCSCCTSCCNSEGSSCVAM